ncbi:hypothetical protein A2U01_0086970, partial [Trifolium medium]|nr:hypothetical protein [Trifolium medium]
MTLASCQEAIFCFNVASRRDAPVRISSTRSSSSRRASSFISSSSGCSVQRDGYPISTGMTASVPYASRNG